MDQKQLGQTELFLSRIGLGTWAMGGPWMYGWGPQSDSESIKTIHAALDHGVNWIDTAPVYGLGHSEEIVGKALKSVSKKPILATKCGLTWNARGRVKPRLKRESVFKEAEASLRRLNIERIDLYQIHWPMPEADIGEAWEALGELKNQGKIRYAGVSNFSVQQLERMNRIHRVASVQSPYSLLKRGIEDDLFAYCRENRIGILAYSPLQCGLLTGKMTPERISSLPPDDHRTHDPMFKNPELSVHLELIGRLKDISISSGFQTPELAIAWVLSHPEITSAIVGARNPGQLNTTLRAADKIIMPRDMQRIDALLAEHKAALAG